MVRRNDKNVNQQGVLYLEKKYGEEIKGKKLSEEFLFLFFRFFFLTFVVYERRDFEFHVMLEELTCLKNDATETELLKFSKIHLI